MCLCVYGRLSKKKSSIKRPMEVYYGLISVYQCLCLSFSYVCIRGVCLFVYVFIWIGIIPLLVFAFFSFSFPLFLLFHLFLIFFSRLLFIPLFSFSPLFLSSLFFPLFLRCFYLSISISQHTYGWTYHCQINVYAFLRLEKRTKNWYEKQ